MLCIMRRGSRGLCPILLESAARRGINTTICQNWRYTACTREYVSEQSDTTEPRIMEMRHTRQKSINHKSELWADRWLRCLVIQLPAVDASFESRMSSPFCQPKDGKGETSLKQLYGPRSGLGVMARCKPAPTEISQVPVMEISWNNL